MSTNYLNNRPLICGTKFTDSNFQHPTIISIANEPSSTNHQDRFIVGNNPTVGKKFEKATSNQIATYFDDIDEFVFETPYIGMEVINTSENKLLKYNGTEWVEELDFFHGAHDNPLPISSGGTSATDKYSALENLNAPHNITIFNTKTQIKYGYVIPLIKLDNNEENVNSFCSGNLIVKSIDTGEEAETSVTEDLFYNLSISVMKKYNEEVPLWSLSIMGDDKSNFEAVTFDYDDCKWFGIKIRNDTYSFNIGYFNGIGSNLELLKLIAYKNFETQEALNEEINNSIATVDLSETGKSTEYITPLKGNFSGSITGEVSLTNLPTQGRAENKALAAVKDAQGNLQLGWINTVVDEIKAENFPQEGLEENTLLTIKENSTTSELELAWTDKINIKHLPDEGVANTKILMAVKNSTTSELELGWGYGGEFTEYTPIQLTNLPEEGQEENKVLGIKLVNGQKVLAWIDPHYAD